MTRKSSRELSLRTYSWGAVRRSPRRERRKMAAWHGNSCQTSGRSEPRITDSAVCLIRCRIWPDRQLEKLLATPIDRDGLTALRSR
jgi:hypothetical protein